MCLLYGKEYTDNNINQSKYNSTPHLILNTIFQSFKFIFLPFCIPNAKEL